MNATPGIYVEDVALSQYQGNSEPINETSPTFSFFESFYPTITLRSIVGFPMVQRLRRFQRVTSFKPFYTLTVSLLHPFYRTNKERLTGDDVYRITNLCKGGENFVCWCRER